MTTKKIMKEFDQGIKDAQNALNSVVAKASLDYSPAYAIGVIHVLERCAEGLKNAILGSANLDTYVLLATLLSELEKSGKAEKEES